MIIGLLGCLINNKNLGCQALTYSLLTILEEIKKENDADFTYFVFETDPCDAATKEVAHRLNIPEEKLFSYDITPLFRFRRFVHHFSVGLNSLDAIKRCDCFIDMTGGDSFTDIYGQYVFDSETNVKFLVKKLGKKLLLGPQTYGPFNLEKNKNKAKRIIEKADIIMTRDNESKDYLLTFTNKDCCVTTDIAFCLPYNDVYRELPNDRIRVGLNVSGLLISEKTENTVLSSRLKTNYDQYISDVIDYLLNNDQYDVYIIPHVGVDGINWVKKKYGDCVKYYDQFQNPIEAKSAISHMDIFIGSRMHATIGSFSACIATIPVAYSRKFTGLFDSLNYPYVIDLNNYTTEECVKKTIDEINNYEFLKMKVLESKSIYENKMEITKQIIKSFIFS